jgi:Glycosyl transferase family group 2
VRVAAGEVITGPTFGPVSLQRRVLEVIPGLLLLAPVAVVAGLILNSPTLMFVIGGGYVMYWALRSLEMGVRQVVEFGNLRRYERIDWSARLAQLTDPYPRLHALADKPRLTVNEAEEMAALRTWVHSGSEVPAPAELYHLVVIPVANEGPEILQGTLDALVAADYPAERLLVCLTFEARSASWTESRIADLVEPYRDRFGMMLTTRHPDGQPGETRVKGANVTWGARVAVAEIRRRGLRDSQVVVSALDSDTQVSRHYFAVLSYTYLTDPNRDVNGYQPVLLFHNNVWEVPAVSRLVGYLASMWTLVDSTQPRRMQLFSSHAIGLPALVGVGYWATNVVPDDSRQHWRLFFRSRGVSRTLPLHVAVSLDAVQAKTLFATMASQYRQIRRWTYGIDDFPYLVEQGLQRQDMPFAVRAHRAVRSLVQFHLWATVPLLMLISRPLLAWLTPNATAPGVQLAGDMLMLSGVLAPVSLVLFMIVALVLLPERPPHRRPTAWATMIAEWLLLPIVIPVFLSLPAIDAQVRLMTGRYLGFRVTPKRRRQRLAPSSADILDAAH